MIEEQLILVICLESKTKLGNLEFLATQMSDMCHCNLQQLSQLSALVLLLLSKAELLSMQALASVLDSPIYFTIFLVSNKNSLEKGKLTVHTA